MDLSALGGTLDASGDVTDYTTRVLLIGQNTDSGSFATGAADAPSVPYRNLFGQPVKRTRMVSESNTPVGTVAQRAGLALNRFNRQRRALKVTTERYETDGTFKVGELAYVFDPESGVFDPARQITFRGEVLHPDVVRISAIGYPITEGHTVGFRRANGTWLDLTRYVVWETGTNEVTVGDLPQSLGGGRVNIAADRAAENAVDLIAPKPPTALDVQTTVLDNGTNGLAGVATLSWTAPTQNADNTALTDLDGYIAQYKLTDGGQSAWSGAFVAGTGTSFPVVPGRNYDFRVYAIDRNGNRSDASSTVSKLTVLDTTPPGPPSDPSVSSFIGQLRIAWDGKMANGSNPPADFFQVDVHVSSTANFTPSTSTLVSSLLEAGVAFATAPYGEARYVKLIALDRSGNASAPSGQVTGSTSQVKDGDVASMNVGKLVSGTMQAEVAMAGRIATALTGARVELNGTGIYKVNADGTFAVAIDGTQALLTGTFRTASTGRRIEQGAAGAAGQTLYYAPDGRYGRIVSFTESSGIEATRFEGANRDANGAARSYMNLNSDNYTSYRARIHEFQSIGPDERLAYYNSVGKIRLWIDNNGMQVNGSGDSMRFQVDNTGAKIWGAYDSMQLFNINDNGLAIWAGSNKAQKFAISNSPAYIQLWPTEGGGSIRFDQGGGEGSPVIALFTNAGYAVAIRAAAGPNGQNLDVLNYNQNVWYTVRASQFAAQSDAESKTEPKSVSRSDMLDEVLSLRVRRYHRLNREDANGNLVANPREEVGFIAQETSERIDYHDPESGHFVDVYQTLALTVGALQALHRDFDEYRKAHA